MASNTVTDNALKRIAEALETQNRELKKIHSAISALNTNIVGASAVLQPKED